MSVYAATFRDSDVLNLATALKQLSGSSRSSLTHLSISALPYTSLVEILLDASPKVTSLHVEIQTVMWGLDIPSHHSTTAESELPGAVSFPSHNKCNKCKYLRDESFVDNESSF